MHIYVLQSKNPALQAKTPSRGSYSQLPAGQAETPPRAANSSMPCANPLL